MTNENTERITVRLSPRERDFLVTFGRYYGLQKPSGNINLSDVVRQLIARSAGLLHPWYYRHYGEMEKFKPDIVDEYKTASILNEIVRQNTCDSLVLEIEDTTLMVTSTLWCNVAYNPNLYSTAAEKKKVVKALRECSKRVSALMNNLADSIEKDLFA